MFIIPISSVVTPLESVSRVFDEYNETAAVSDGQDEASAPTFFDVFAGIFNNAVDANAQKQADIMQLMLGDTDSLEQIQANISKAEVATELLVNVKNAVVDSYNEIIKMSI